MQVNSLTGIATNTIIQAQQKATSAAQTIANLPVQNNEVGGSKDISSADTFKPIVSLKEAEQENTAGVKLLQVEKKTTGALLDIQA
jgi:hypothetical protein